jgi:hypothetical protein
MSGPLARGDRSTGFVKATAPFVGRAQELASFDRWLREAAAGEPRVVLIEGDAGIGNSSGPRGLIDRRPPGDGRLLRPLL